MEIRAKPWHSAPMQRTSTMSRGLRRGWCALLLLATGAVPASAQSLYMKKGEKAVEGSLGWSVGPSSNGTEGVVSASVDGRVDVGISLARYT